ncbi:MULTISPECIES: hypothetical protein [Micromonospora]|nr:hypothetical protein [Micromonospora yangpuensis]GGL99183.1 hypothetical protein GCM10012279_15740 [Micromonospora yangpuensis]
MTPERRRGGVPPVGRQEARDRLWLAVASGVVALVLLAYLGHRGYVELGASGAHRAGTLVVQQAEAVAVGYRSLDDGYGGGSVQEVRYRLPGGGERTSVLRDRAAYLTVEEGQTVRVGTWRGHLVTVEDQYVRDPWPPGVMLVSTLLPPAFVLMVVQLYGVWRLRRERSFGGGSGRAYAVAAAVLAFVTGFVATGVGGVGWLLPAAILAASALVPLAWFAVREIGGRRAAARG